MKQEESFFIIEGHKLAVINELVPIVGGVNEAIILQQIYYLTHKYRKNYKKGYIWVYKTYPQWKETIPWLSISSIRRALNNLRNDGFVITAQFSTHVYHNTLWYRVNEEQINAIKEQLDNPDAISAEIAVTDDEDGENLVTVDKETVKEETQLPVQNEQSTFQSEQVIPVQIEQTNNNIKIDKYKTIKEKYKKEKSPVTQTAVSKADPAELDKVIDYLNQQAKTHYRKNATNRDLVKARINEGYTIQDCMKVIDNKTTQWLNTEWEQYLRPRTLFQKSKFESYLNTKPPKRTGTVVKEQMPDYNQQAEQPKPVDRQRIKELSARLEKLKQKQKEVSS